MPCDATPFSARAVWELCCARTVAWHNEQTSAADGTFLPLVQLLHRQNFDLWHEEDKARAPAATSDVIADVKRRIDKLNQTRNNIVEQLDVAIQAWLQQARRRTADTATWNTETPGAAIDRLSILSLKLFHMEEQATRHDADAQHRTACAQKVRTMVQQRDDLVQALQWLLDALLDGRKVLKLYKQFKMYNDASLNPQIYGAAEKVE